MLTISEFARLGQVSPRMLRHYGETGLLAPAQIDAHTGYRFYDVAQLGRLHRLVALRELGFGLRAHLRDAGARPGINIARYEGPAEDGSAILHLGFDIGSQDVAADDLLRIVDLPAVRVAALVHRGTMEDIAPAFDALIHWTKDSGYTLAGPSRELYHHWDDEDPAGHVTELQLLLDVS